MKLVSVFFVSLIAILFAVLIRKFLLAELGNGLFQYKVS